MMERGPEDLKPLRFPRLLLLGQIWGKFRTVAEYGFETLKVPQSEIFTKTEAEFAFEHATDCYLAASQLMNKILYSEESL